MTKRVLIAGLFHETHTFLETLTTAADFTVRTGEELFAARGDGSPLSGALQIADEAGWEVTPVIDMRATPGGPVEDAVFEQFSGAVLSAIQDSLDADSLDGILLILHGAMVTQSQPDVEGELIRRIRAFPTADAIPICGVLDLHGNISPHTIEQTQGLIAYRCNPHTDSHEASQRGASLLNEIMTEGIAPAGVWAQPPVMWPPTGTGTSDDPMKTLETMAREIEQNHHEIFAVNVFAGFSFSDTPHTGVSFSAYTFGDPAVAARELAGLSDWTVANRKSGNKVEVSLDTVLPEVRDMVTTGQTPVILVEPSDNIGGGAPGDTTTLLQALLAERFENAAVVINDPAAVSLLSDAQPGETRTLTIGAALSGSFCEPVDLEVQVVSSSDGQFTLEDRHSHLASMHGININMGPSSAVRTHGLNILLTTRKTPPFDLGQLRSQGIIPEECSVIGVKAAVAHRQGYDPITAATFTVNVPGPCSSDLTGFPFTKVRRPIYPLDR
ncbi:MAG: M81 family metallopeptidase [Planctomycetaceae bacterium]